MKSLALIFLGLIFVTEAARANEDATPEQNHKWWLDAVVGASVVSGLSAPNLDTNNRVTFLGGMGVCYAFARSIGAFVGGQFTTRGIRGGASGNSLSSPFLDIPAGIGFRYHGSFFSENGSGFFKLGGMYAQPLQGNFSGDTSVVPGLTGSLKTEGAFALYVESGTLFPVTETFGLGFTFVLKYGLSDPVANGPVVFNAPFDFTIGLASAIAL